MKVKDSILELNVALVSVLRFIRELQVAQVLLFDLILRFDSHLGFDLGAAGRTNFVIRFVFDI